MVASAVMEGSIPADGVVQLLRAIEDLLATGDLHFEDGSVRGIVRVEGGQLALDQPDRPDGNDPVELFLARRGGTFYVVQVLPDLEDTTGDEAYREGSLATHAPSDLMNFCERVGLTGVLRFEHGQGFAVIHYDRGFLTGIAADGVVTTDVNDVFGWQEGTFRIETRASAPRLPPVPTQVEASVPTPLPAPPRAPTGASDAHAMRVVEMRLDALMKEAEGRRPKTVRPPDPSIRPPRPATLPPKVDATVRVIFLGGSGEMLLRQEDLRGARKSTLPPLGLPGQAPYPLVHGDHLATQQVLGEELLAKQKDRVAKAKEASVAKRAPLVTDGMPRAAIVALVVLLLLGLSAFVATLVGVS